MGGGAGGRTPTPSDGERRKDAPFHHFYSNMHSINLFEPLPAAELDYLGSANGTSPEDEKMILEIRFVVWLIAGCVSFLSAAISMDLIFRHARNFSCPPIQSKIMGILWMVPIYAVDSWLSLRFPQQAVYIDMFRDCYEVRWCETFVEREGRRCFFP